MSSPSTTSLHEWPARSAAVPAGIADSVDAIPRPFLPFRRMSMPVVPSSFTMDIQGIKSADSEPTRQFADLDLSPSPATRRSPRKFMKSSRPPSLASPNHRLSHSRSNHRNSVSQVPDEQRVKRWKVLKELHQTEMSYLDGLEIIYSHFLTPLMASLETADPILNRTELNSIFANFIDIWNFHRSFFSSLSSLFSADVSESLSPAPKLAPILQSHFPYLSLYTPFVTAFPIALAKISELSASNSVFAAFLATQEKDPICKQLGLQAWLLTVIQRCPRYLLLIKELIEVVPPGEQEHRDLTSAHEVLSKITLALNSSLQTHSQTLSLLALQKATTNLPFPLVAAGRMLIKRGALLKSGRRNEVQEFLLFSDCLMWLTPSSPVNPWNKQPGLPNAKRPSRPLLGSRTRSRSDADLPKVRNVASDSAVPQLASLGQARNQWTYQGHVSLVDLEVVIGQLGSGTDGDRFDILSPEYSFTIYALSPILRKEWVSVIRGAKAALMVSLNSMQSGTTLTSSDSNEHIRRALQAVPYAPQDTKANEVKRGRVDHFTPPIWVPDHKTNSCMRCGREFTWIHRRHHCRLCGRCVCAACSGKTFFITDESRKKKSSQSARACNACYDTVFPVIPSPTSEDLQPSVQNQGTLSTLPNWKTTKDVNLAASALELLGEPPRQQPHRQSRHYIPSSDRDPLDDLLALGPDPPPVNLRLSPKNRVSASQHSNKRLSIPVIALQQPSITTRMDGSATREKRLFLVSGSARQEASVPPDSPKLGPAEGVAEYLQELLAKSN